jgi:serine/threonine protein kinase
LKNPFEEFKIIEKLGKGGFGCVYLVEHIKSRRHFAMKEIAPNDDADLEDTLTEIALQNMASKGHKNIVGIHKSYDWKHDGVDKFFLIMEWMDAGDLSTMLKTIPGQFSEPVIVYILKEILSALDHMHNNNQIHRDLKPLNVMLTTDGLIKLGDFGLAAQLVVDEQHQKDVKGTPKWMAPEILLTKPYNELTDIWSLGIIAYELAVGVNPYQGMSLS